MAIATYPFLSSGGILDRERLSSSCRSKPIQGQIGCGSAKKQLFCGTPHFRSSDERIRVVKPIRVLLADDHALVRAGLRTLLSTVAGVEVVGEAGDGQEALAQLAQVQPHIVVTDIA